MNASENQIVVYQPNETVRLDVRLENETVWLNRHQMAQLFGRDIKTIGKHIANALSEELASDLSVTNYEKPQSADNSTVAKFATVQKEGNREVVRQVEYYSLDVVLSVGYRVKSAQGTSRVSNLGYSARIYLPKENWMRIQLFGNSEQLPLTARSI